MKKLITLLITVVLSHNIVNAKWWIFGKSRDEVTIKYILINGVSQDETAGKITLFSETLKDSNVLVKGRAYAGKGTTVGLVRYTLDNKNTWKEAKFSENGDFEFSFKAQKGEKYTLCIEITNTVGKTNKVDETCREIKISDENITSKIKEVLDDMFKAYSDKNLQAFMRNVSNDFAGDRDFLELAIKKDFSALDNIRIHYTINNIASGQKVIAVSLTYSRSFLSKKSGTITQDNGITEMVFKIQNNRFMLYSMKKPLLFGLSDADNVATGTTPGQSDGIVIDEGGSVGGSNIVTIYDCNTIAVYNFSSNDYICDMSIPNGDIWFYHSVDAIGYSLPNEHKEINKPLSSVTTQEAKDPTGFSNSASINPVIIGKTYIFKISNEYWGIEPIEMPQATYGGAQFKIKFKVKKF